MSTNTQEPYNIINGGWALMNNTILCITCETRDPSSDFPLREVHYGINLSGASMCHVDSIGKFINKLATKSTTPIFPSLNQYSFSMADLTKFVKFSKRDLLTINKYIENRTFFGIFPIESKVAYNAQKFFLKTKHETLWLNDFMTVDECLSLPAILGALRPGLFHDMDVIHFIRSTITKAIHEAYKNKRFVTAEYLRQCVKMELVQTQNEVYGLSFLNFEELSETLLKFGAKYDILHLTFHDNQ
jgi:hypothetical protein